MQNGFHEFKTNSLCWCKALVQKFLSEAWVVNNALEDIDVAIKEASDVWVDSGTFVNA